MTRYILTGCLMALCAAGAMAQDKQDNAADGGMGGYSSMEIDAGLMKGNFATGAIDELADGVKIRLLSDKPDTKPLPIRAKNMKFTWTEGRTTPDRILMEGNVEVEHPDASITAERAEWNFETGDLVFTGNPVVNNDKIKGLRGEKMRLNVKNNTFEVMRVRADQVPLQSGDAAGGVSKNDPSLLRESDIKDWGALIDILREEGKSSTATPGKQLLSQISNDNRQLLMSLDKNVLVQRKEDMLKLVNSVLRSTKLYNADAWQGKTLPEEAQKLVAAEKRTAEEQTRLNRLLLSTAWPALVAAP